MSVDPLRTTPDVGSRVTLDADAFAANVGVFRGVIGPGRRLGCVVKGNAYGHGFLPTLRCLHPLTDVIHVITAGEALAIRAWEAVHGTERRDVLVIGPVSPREVVALARARVAVVVASDDVEGAVPELLRAEAPPLELHVHVDTGLSREGFVPEELPVRLAWLAEAGEAVHVAGILTHFADTEDVTEQTWARRQLDRYAEGEQALCRLLASLGRPTTLVRHAAASAAALVLPESRLDVARVGVSLYGLWPSRETRISARLVHGDDLALRPVLSWSCPSQVVKDVPADTPVGYGCTHRCLDDTRIAVLPVGYHDGYPRLLSNRAHVLVQGRRCPVLGRVMMNHVVVDVSRVPGRPARVEATLLGEDGSEAVRAEDLAAWAQTINYEITTRIGAHLPRMLRGAPEGDGPVLPTRDPRS